MSWCQWDNRLICVGLFATKSVNNAVTTNGLFYGAAELLSLQLFGVVFTITSSTVGAVIVRSEKFFKDDVGITSESCVRSKPEGVIYKIKGSERHNYFFFLLYFKFETWNTYFSV